MKRLDPALLWLGAVILLFADLLFRPMMIFGRDVDSYFLPLESAVHRAWASGRLPLWFAGVSGGKPLLPNPNAGVFYPLRLAAAVLPFAAGFKLYLVAHVFLAGWGAIRLARTLGISRSGQLVASTVYALSGPFLSTLLFSNMLPGAAALPWAALAGLGLARRPDSRRAALAAGLLTAVVLAGEPFTILLAAALLFSFASTAVPESRLRAVGLAAAACGAALLAAGIQLVPMVLYLPETFRAQVRFRLLATLQWSLSPARLLEWVVPYPFGDPTKFVAWRTWGGRFFDGRPGGYFATLFCGAFAAAALFLPAARPRERGVRLALRAIFAGSLLLASAAVFVPNRLLSLPTRIALRYPEKLVLGAILVMAIWAAHAWDAARTDRRIAPILAGVAAALLAAGAVSRVFAPAAARAMLAWTGDGRAPAGVVARELPRALFSGSLHWALAGIAALLLARFPGRRPLVAAALAALTIDVALATRRIVAEAPERDVLGAPPAAVAIRALDPGARYSFVPQAMYFPIAGSRDAERSRRGDGPPEIALRAFAGSLWGIPAVLNSDPDASDLAGHAFARRDLFDLLARSPGAAARFLGGYSVRWLVRFPDAPPLPGVVPAAAAGDVTIDEIPDAAPRVSIAEDWKSFPTAAAAERALLATAPPPSTAILETGGGDGADAPGRLLSLSERENGFEAGVSCPTGCWLRVTRGWWKFRDVRIDGGRSVSVPERIALSALRVPPGTHRISWREKVPGGILGALASAVGLAAIGVAAGRRTP